MPVTLVAGGLLISSAVGLAASAGARSSAADGQCALQLHSDVNFTSGRDYNANVIDDKLGPLLRQLGANPADCKVKQSSCQVLAIALSARFTLAPNFYLVPGLRFTSYE